MPLAAAPANKTPAKKSSPQFVWPAETLSGRIITVSPDTRVVVIKTSDGIPFDFDITKHTRINAASRPVTLKDLQTDLNKQVAVKFVPERRGDVAQSIQIGS